MIVEVKVPSPGESITEVEIGTWLVEDGAVVQKDQEIAEVEKQYRRGIITDGERKNKVQDIWTHTGEELANALFRTLEHNDGRPEMNPVFMMVDSGARGNRTQVNLHSGASEHHRSGFRVDNDIAVVDQCEHLSYFGITRNCVLFVVETPQFGNRRDGDIESPVAQFRVLERSYQHIHCLRVHFDRCGTRVPVDYGDVAVLREPTGV